jgi:hypothetical protein
MNIVVCLVFAMKKVGMFFVMTSVTLCLESGYCDCNNILDVPAEAISMAVCVSFLNYFFSKIIIRLVKKNQLEFISVDDQ